VAKALWPANGVLVYAAILQASRRCFYGYFLVQRGGRMRMQWPRHDGGVASAVSACTAMASMG